MGSTEPSPREYVDAVCARARAAARDLSALDDASRSRALRTGAARLRVGAESILAANRNDVTAGEASAMSPAMLDRLTLTPARIESMAIASSDNTSPCSNLWYMPNSSQSSTNFS